MKKLAITVDIKSCARCGQNHDKLIFKLLTQPQKEWTHWVLCPVSAEPIMLKICSEQKTEEHFLSNLVGKWKNIYNVVWCQKCKIASIICPACGTCSCNGGSCEKCHEDFEQFYNTVKATPDEYLNIPETFAYQKGLILQKIIVESIQRGENKLNFKKLKEQGYLSRRQQELFS
jgi:hypothetical protein